MGHCKDCCCAQSWEALGITEYTNKSIPEHIVELRGKLEVQNKVLHSMASHLLNVQAIFGVKGSLEELIAYYRIAAMQNENSEKQR